MSEEENSLPGTGLIEHDPWLEPHREALKHRYGHYLHFKYLCDEAGGFDAMTKGHEYFGFNRGEHEGKAGVWYREWAPEAFRLDLIGEFNAWDGDTCRMEKDDYGVWSIFLPDELYTKKLIHGSRIKVRVHGKMGVIDRLPAYIKRAVQEEGEITYVGIFWMPETEYKWKHKQPETRGGLRIYEAHVGMSSEEGKVNSFTEFKEQVLPHIAELGYNAIQFMAIMEHPYYGSFGYHVSNFFAVSSRFGTPDELKELIDAAHALGIQVIMDMVHSHMVKNIHESLAWFDGTDYQYTHAGTRGEHEAWDSLCFDYSKTEVLRFLLSNLRYWLDEYKFDGFRFDGVTSMMYIDHGLGKDFGSYEDYFDGNVDRDAVAYLTLANDVIHQINPNAITIAEDMSGMVGIARPVEEGGIGFDYRLAMGIPDYWIKTLKEKQDEDWNLNDVYHTMMNRRHNEKHIGYAESHDQALVGDKTIIFWLIDADMYTHMSKMTPSLTVDRGLALHKIIRLITFSLSGEGYLNFMGNEFGHPEWIDFPREGNGYSYHYARRQWSLIEKDHLKYAGLNDFDRAMQQLDQKYEILEDKLIEQLLCHEDSRQLVYRRGPLVFAFNFHPTESYDGLRIPVPDQTDYKVILNSDDKGFEGHGTVEEGVIYPWQDEGMYGRDQTIQMYLPARSVQVLAPIGLC